MNWLLKDRFSCVDIAVVLLATQICNVLDIIYLDWALLLFVIGVLAYYIKACIDGIRAASNLTENGCITGTKLKRPKPPAPPGRRDIKGKRQ